MDCFKCNHVRVRKYKFIMRVGCKLNKDLVWKTVSNKDGYYLEYNLCPLGKEGYVNNNT